MNHFEQLNEKIYDSGALSPELVAFMQAKKHKKIHPNRFQGFHDFLVKHDFKTGLEIGRSSGYSALAFATFYPEATLDSIDIRGRPQHLELFTAMGVEDRINIIIGDSMSIPVNKIYDYILIDGDHSYEGAKQDWQQIQSHVRQGSYVIFDDIQLTWEGAKSVAHLWKELEATLPSTSKICADMGVVQI